jgi:DNA-directed RNA polymerase specialized sigma24 family protein
VSKFIPGLNPSQGHGSQKSGALVSVSTGTVMSHASRVMGECASTLEGPCHIVNLP